MAEMNEESFAAELQKVFLAETREMLEDVESIVMEIEQNPDDAAKIDRLFRIVHTIKGSAHVAGFTQLGAFAHAFETLLAAMREKKLRVGPDLADVLLSGTDCLGAFVKALAEDPAATVDAGALEARITAVVAGTSAQPARTPLAAPAVQPAPAVKAEPFPEVPAAVEPTAPATILVCDDEPHICDILRDILEDGGYRIVTAGNGLEALAVMKAQPVDVIMTDLMMPQLNGIDFIREVRKFNQLIPVVFVSGHSAREHFKSFIALGVDEFVDKPFNPEDILLVARRAVKARRLRDALLGLARLTFKAYVSIQKIEALSDPGSATPQRTEEAAHLDRCVAEIRLMTMHLLQSERAVGEP